MKSICVFGDSTAWGAYDDDKGGWVNRLWLFLVDRDEEEYVELYNLSIPGGTTETILERFEFEARVREADALIFQTGGNDSASFGREGDAVVPIERFRLNVEEIIRRAKKITPSILFIGYKNCDESKTTPVHWADMHYTNDRIKTYNAVTKDACEKSSVHYMDIFGTLIEDFDFDDGLHPNARGHKKIYDKVRDHLIRIGWI